MDIGIAYFGIGDYEEAQKNIAMAKWYAGDMAVKSANEALQIHGAYGYMDEYKVQRLYRDAKVLEIYEGTKEIEKTIVARALLGL